MQTTSQENLQKWLDSTATLLRLMSSREISMDTTERISIMLKQQRKVLNDTQLHQLVLNLTDMLNNSKTETEFLQKLKKLELQKD